MLESGAALGGIDERLNDRQNLQDHKRLSRGCVEPQCTWRWRTHADIQPTPELTLSDTANLILALNCVPGVSHWRDSNDQPTDETQWWGFTRPHPRRAGEEAGLEYSGVDSRRDEPDGICFKRNVTK